MAYTPTVWKTGDVITAEKLNKAEQGIAAASDAVFYVTFTYDELTETTTADKTMAEIEEAISAGKAVFCKLTGSKYIGVLTGHIHDASPENTYVNFMGYDTNNDSSKNYIAVASFYGDGYYARTLYELTVAQ